MKQHLLRLLTYNKQANQKLIIAIQQLPEKDASLALVSHLITSQDKWLNRVTEERPDGDNQWYGKVFGIDDIADAWEHSISAWIRLIETYDEVRLDTDILFTRPVDGKLMKVKLADVALQVSYHSMHHRAQINKLISGQGFTPPPTDFVLTAISEA